MVKQHFKNIYMCTRIHHRNIKCLFMMTGMFDLGILSFSTTVSELWCGVATLLSFHLTSAFGHWQLASFLMQHQHILCMTFGKRFAAQLGKINWIAKTNRKIENNTISLLKPKAFITLSLACSLECSCQVTEEPFVQIRYKSFQFHFSC